MSKEEYEIMSGNILKYTASMIEYYVHTSKYDYSDPVPQELIDEWTEILERMAKLKYDLQSVK